VGLAEAAEAEEFRAAEGGSLRTESPALRAVLHCLFEAWPAPLAFDALWDGCGPGCRTLAATAAA